MLALGLGGSNHDFSACLVDNGEVVYAIEEERIRRRKYSVGVNSLFNQGWRYCLDAHQACLADVEMIVADDTLLPPAYFHFRSRTTLIRHHLAHAASTFYPSPFQRAAILVVDGAGSLIEGEGVETLTTAVGDGERITELSKVLGTNWTTNGLPARRGLQVGDSDHSLGFMYKAVSKTLGFALYQDQGWYLTEDGKTMGLAAYGDNRYHQEFRKYLNLLPEGRYELHLKNDGLLDFVSSALDGFNGEERFARCADLASAAQNLLEETLLHVTRQLYVDTGLSDLCLAGGVALNCVANGRLLRETEFDNIFIQPAAGDGGCAVGAAFYGYHVLGERRRDRGPCSPQRGQRHTYFGRPYRDSEVIAAIKAADLPYRRLDLPALMAAHILSRSLLLGWFTGGSEFGPRALGHRSILADPRDARMKDVINARVKHRENFRPFAPAILAEYVSDYFHLAIESPYMLLAAPVVERMRAVIPATVHVDGAARVQTVNRTDNGRYREVIEWFHRLTGVPVVLNTSFNDRGEPIVESPAQALDFFGPSQLDYLVIEDYLVAHREEEIVRALAYLDGADIDSTPGCSA